MDRKHNASCHSCCWHGGIKNHLVASLTPDISALYNQVRLFSQPTHRHSLESLLLLNYCCQPPSWFNVKVCSCFPSLPISLFFWPYLFPPLCTVALCWWSYFSVEYFTVVLIQTWTNHGFFNISLKMQSKSPTLYNTLKGESSEVSHFVGFYCRFLFYLKMWLDVMDKKGHIHPIYPPVDLVIGRYTLCISC